MVQSFEIVVDVKDYNEIRARSSTEELNHSGLSTKTTIKRKMWKLLRKCDVREYEVIDRCFN